MKEEEENKKLQKKADTSSPVAFSVAASVAAKSGAALLGGRSLPSAVLMANQPAPHSASLPPRPVLQAMTEMTDTDLADSVARIEAAG